MVEACAATVEAVIASGADIRMRRPANETKLRKTSRAELDALAEGRRGKELACTTRAGILCGPRGTELAMAVDEPAHEAFHLQGIQDDARTECRSLQ